MSNELPYLINHLRQKACLTTQQLATKANVPQSLISGLQSGNRRVGEDNARKIGTALNLTGRELEDFIYKAINSSTERILKEYNLYPSEILNLVADELQSTGISPMNITRCIRKPQLVDYNPDAVLYLEDGRRVLLNLEVTCC